MHDIVGAKQKGEYLLKKNINFELVYTQNEDGSYVLQQVEIIPDPERDFQLLN